MAHAEIGPDPRRELVQQMRSKRRSVDAIGYLESLQSYRRDIQRKRGKLWDLSTVYIPNPNFGYQKPELLDYINREGVLPVEGIIEQINRGVRILGIGDTHTLFGDHLSTPQKSALRLLRELQKRSPVKIGDICIEVDERSQDLINTYNIFKRSIRQFSLPAYSKRVIRFAKKHKIRVHCVDHRSGNYFEDGKDTRRNTYLHQRTEYQASKHPDTLTILLAGNFHISHLDALGNKVNTNDTGMHRQLGLDKYLSIVQDAIHDPERKIPRGGRFILTDVQDERYKRTPGFSGTYGNIRATIFLSSKNIFYAWARRLALNYNYASSMKVSAPLGRFPRYLTKTQMFELFIADMHKTRFI